ncbi:MAG TPA: nitronate monooxygenase family protein [Dehalococcoidia bacterium]|nr:nitronate monooxygenase family protein [Dehalococcoidia bacterium]
MHTSLCDDFGIEFPIFAFSHCRDVVAAVSRAGGMGVLGALAFTTEQLEIELRWIDDHVDGKPYGVDVVMPASSVGEGAGALDLEKMIPDAHRQFVEDTLRRFNVPPLPADVPAAAGLLAWTHDKARTQVEVALAHPIRLLANALGAPPPDVIEKAHAHGVKVAALVGNAHQAQQQVAAGTDIIVASGYEAGGHTGEVTSMVLIPEVVSAVAPRPVLAAGGIGSGRQAAAALALGAQGVWTGSIWLTAAESDTHPVVQQKLFAATSRDTVRSRSMSGKPARQLRTPWTDAWDAPDSPGALPMPLQFMVVAEAQSRMHRYCGDERTGAKDLVGTPVGQIVGSMRSARPAREIIYSIVEEYVETVARMNATLDAPVQG